MVAVIAVGTVPVPPMGCVMSGVVLVPRIMVHVVAVLCVVDMLRVVAVVGVVTVVVVVGVLRVVDVVSVVPGRHALLRWLASLERYPPRV